MVSVNLASRPTVNYSQGIKIPENTDARINALAFFIPMALRTGARKRSLSVTVQSQGITADSLCQSCLMSAPHN